MTERVFAGPIDAEFDALADLFLNPSRARPGQRPPSTPAASAPANGADVRCRVEGLIVGHLPVLAGAWIGQYLRQAGANSHGGVGLVRCTRDHVFVDIAGGHTAEPNRWSSIEDAVRAAEVGRWILVAAPAHEMDLAQLATEGSLDRLTVLTGADEAAVVSCYSTIKSLWERAGADRGALEIEIGLVGADDRRAAEIGDRLERATGQFLGKPARITTRIERVSGGGTARVYGGPDPRPPKDLIPLLLGPAPDAAALATVRPNTQPAEGRPSPEQIERSATDSLASGPTAQRMLADHVPGLSRVAVSCPYAPGVEFAKCGAGRLHLLARDEQGTGLSQLTTGTAWAKAHAPLLTRVHSDLSGAIGERHLFVSRAGAAKPLLMSDLRVHLLTTVRSGEGVVELCIDLN